MRALLKPWLIILVLVLIFFFMFLRSGAIERVKEDYKENGVTKQRTTYELHIERFGNYLLGLFE